MSLNRTIEPPIEVPDRIVIPQALMLENPSQVPCFSIHAPGQDVLKVEVIFDAGLYYENKPIVAAATNDLADDGSKTKTAREIAELFDFYGSSIHTDHSYDKASFTLLTLGKFAKETLPLFMEIISAPIFPEEELHTYQIQHKQKLAVSNKKVDFVARKLFNQQLFGSAHPYGYYATETDYNNLDRQKLVDFHQSAYLEGPLSIIISGNISDPVKLSVIENITNSGLKNNVKKELLHATNGPPDSSALYLEKPDSLQSAIRIGRKMFNKTHPDFVGMSILSTILGGYFGSRLMSNIREDKGYTYGIGSALVSLQHSGYFFITTEVGSQVTQETLKEIYFEINRLIEEPVKPEELKTVKNYLAGAFLRSIDGAFALADKWKGIYFYGLDYGYYARYLETLRNMGPEVIQNLANKYLKKSDLTEVVVGKK